MLINYFKIAFRNLQKNKLFASINIFGLAVGLSCFMLITAFVYDELNYDKYPKQSDQLYRVVLQISQNGGVTEWPDVDVAVGAGIKNAYPEVLASTRILNLGNQFVKYGNKEFKEQHIALCDSNFLQLFSIPLIEGDEKSALTEVGTIVITKTFSKKYFGDEPAIGKTLTLRNGVIKVTGVIDQVPSNSHFHYDAFLSMASSGPATYSHTWSNIGYYTYLLLREGTDPKKLEAKFPELIAKYVVPENQHDMGISLVEAQKDANNWRFYLMPVKNIHLHSNTKYELEANGDIQYVYIFSALSVFILLLASVNFTNLSTGSSSKRSKEVGIRKVLGSVKGQLVAQFLTESILLTFCAMLLACLFVNLLLPSFNEISGKNIHFSFLLNYKAICFALALIVLVGILAGVYPAFFLASFQTINVLKGSSFSDPVKRSGLRKGLVVFQFVISTSLIIATILVYQQLHYMQNKKLGYDKNQVLFIEDADNLGDNQVAFRQQLLKDSRVISATISKDDPVNRVGTNVGGSVIYAKGAKEKEIVTSFFFVDENYISTLGMKMAAGRNFSKDFSGDSSGVLINEATVRDLGWKDNNSAIGKVIVISGQQEFTVVGVVNDFNYTSAKVKIAPLMMIYGHNHGSIMVKINMADVKDFLADLKKQWDAYNPGIPFSFYFLDDHFAFLYKTEQKTGQIFTIFAVVGILIACLGLFGLVAFATEQRKKEIGIRKVLGASINQVLFLLSRQFLLLVSIAFLISIPLTWWAMHSWLNNFAYRTNITWAVFVMAGLSVIFIALMTVILQAMKAANANPVKSLRTE